MQQLTIGIVQRVDRQPHVVAVNDEHRVVPNAVFLQLADQKAERFVRVVLRLNIIAGERVLVFRRQRQLRH
ncbi:hypothetical protein D3C84_1210370 [compost metagenome]